jgi:hypothetical protein
MGTRGEAMILSEEPSALSRQASEKTISNNAGNLEITICDLKNQGAHPQTDTRPSDSRFSPEQPFLIADS